ncbi:MAG: PIG-L deacetylase family protein [Acidothermaceae bacterium]
MRDDAAMGYTLVSVHAHPDDESLLTGGTLARAAAEGHRVVLVVATAGGEGLTSGAAVANGMLADRRLEELRLAAEALGVAQVHLLGYDDSGMDGDAGRDGRAFARIEVERVAEELADLLRAERADVVTVYDPAGGYGHPDHVQVYRVGVRAAQLAGTPVVLEATIDRTLLLRVLRVLRVVRVGPPDWHPKRFSAAYTERSLLTHRVDVSGSLAAKRAAMAAHSSQAVADVGTRTLAILLRLPGWVFRRAVGREWFVEHGRQPGGALLDDVFTTLRDRRPADR